jgi:hypothetical protein
MYRAILAATGVVLMAGAAAPATAAEGGSAPAAADDRYDPDKVICRTIRPPTGTRVASARNQRKVCQTRQQWQDQEREAQEALKVRDRGLCTNPDRCKG